MSSCGGELSLYLQNFDNWNDPIIPPEPGCPVPVYDPEYFVDGSTGGSNWSCVDTSTGASGQATNVNYKSIVLLHTLPNQQHVTFQANY